MIFFIDMYILIKNYYLFIISIFLSQAKNLRRLIQHRFKMYSSLTESDCVFKFFETLSTVTKFNQERFKCALGVSLKSLQLYSFNFQPFYDMTISSW